MRTDGEVSGENLERGSQCPSCCFERALCLQEGKCLLELAEQYSEVRWDMAL